MTLHNVSGLLSNPEPGDELEEANLVTETGKDTTTSNNTSDSEKVVYDTSDNRQVLQDFVRNSILFLEQNQFSCE